MFNKQQHRISFEHSPLYCTVAIQYCSIVESLKLNANTIIVVVLMKTKQGHDLIETDHERLQLRYLFITLYTVGRHLN